MLREKIKVFFNRYTPLNDEEGGDEKDWFDTPCPESQSTVFQRALYVWVQRVVWKGYKGKTSLQLSDISDLPDKLKVNHNLQYMRNINYNTKYPLIFHCYKEFTRRNYLIIVFKLLTLAFSVLVPIILKNLLVYIQTPSPKKSIEFLLCFALFFASLCLTMTQQHGYWKGMNNALQIRGTLFSLILEKLFKINNSSKRNFNSGKVMNLISVDLETFLEFFWNNHVEIFLLPLQVSVLLILLFTLVGVSGLFGFLVMVVAMPTTTFLSSRSSRHYLKSLSHSDERVSLIGELIGGIRFLKLYAWEKTFLDRVEEKRRLQLSEVFKMVLFWLFSSLLTQSLSALVLLTTFTVYSLLGHELDITVAFTALTIFVNMRRPLEMIPEGFQRLLKLMASSKRIEDFLQCPEVVNNIDVIQSTHIQQDIIIENGYLDWNDGEDELVGESLSESSFNLISQSITENDDEIEMLMTEASSSSGHSIQMKQFSSITLNGSADDDQDHLKIADTNEMSTSRLVNLHFKAPVGKLTIICGPVGCGKSTLIHSLIGEIHKQKGLIRSHKNVGFTTQQPFLLSASLRENVLFGKEYNRERYLRVLEACALNVDLQQFPASDFTEIGERGINISGGQKARIALARALYSDPDCLILDDPLNAVDTEVAKHLFEQCIQGLMANKTRVLVTHQLQFLAQADYIAVFQNDTIVQGTYQELKEKGINFESLLKAKQMGLDSKIANESNPQGVEQEDDGIKEPNHKETHPVFVQKPIHELISEGDDKDLLERAKLIIKEDRAEGAVGIDIYLPFLKAGGSLIHFGFIIFIYAISQVVFQGSDFWLAVWTQQKLSTQHSHGFYLLIYFFIILGFIILIAIRYMLLSRFLLRSTRKIHHRLLNAVTFAGCIFFDTNPSGRILNRFSKDVTDVDVKLLPNLSDFLYCFSTVIISILMMVILNPLIIIPLSFLMVFYYYAQKIYRASSRDLKRMEAISRSPIYSLLQESWNGIVTIRSLHQEERFIKEMRSRVDINQRLYFYNFAVNRWVGVRLEIVSSLTVLFASLFAVFQDSNPGLASLSITTALGITGFLNWTTRTFTETEVKMNAVERVLKYADTPSEDSKIKEQQEIHNIQEVDDLPKNWPQHGKIEFQNLEVKYRDNMEPVIRDITFTINPQEKIGIVGRTGAGKSTIGWSLFRLVEASKGAIIIDGIDISRISLYDLRSRLGVVPQDPFIFSGSLRLNVDPFNEYTDEDIWNALEKVQLKKLIQAMPEKLDSNMAESGEGLSLGEKQLLCLCRALLRNSKIVLFDEASASLDYKTDSIIKTVIRNNFKDSTVLTIAHRLDTIVDSNRIIVMDAGKLLEFDTPQNLINDMSSKFSQLVYAQSNNFK